MSEIVRIEETPETAELHRVDPQARGVDINVRPATQDDFAFIDALQKSEPGKLGFFVEQALRKRIEEGNMLIAEAMSVNREQSTINSGEADSCVDCSLGTVHSPAGPVPVGYCHGLDRYQKRSELGVIYQMAVLPEYRRMNVAATLLQAQFDKSAYGTRLYCCWCKQSLEANRFWEAMGFVPLAFRAAGRTTIEKIKKKTGSMAGGVHIFWQKPVRVEDVEAARRGEFRGWWYPYETSGGAMMESRVILPLPPEVQWDEATPVVLPGAERRAAETKLLEAKLDAVAVREKEAKMAARKGKGKNAKGPRGGGGEGAKGKHAAAPRAVVSYGFGAESGFGDLAEPPEVLKPDEAAVAAEAEARAAELARLKEEKDAAKEAVKKAQRKSDPELVAFARDLRDRWQEHVAPGSELAGMLAGKARGKYDVGRVLENSANTQPAKTPEAVCTPAGVKRLDAA